MPDRTIPQRELRNYIAAILRAAEAGETFTVTVRGRPVARVVPAGDGGPRLDVDRETIRRILATPVDDALCGGPRCRRGAGRRPVAARLSGSLLDTSILISHEPTVLAGLPPTAAIS